MIRYKLEPWAEGDTEATGTLVATITDDSAYKGMNQWYEAEGLTDGTAYYFKAFPHVGGQYNAVIGANEAVCRAGLLWLEYTFDADSGNQITDTSGNGRHATSVNVAHVQSLVGNGAKGSGNSYIIMPSTCPANMTICLFVKPNEDVAVGSGQRRAVNWMLGADLTVFSLFFGNDKTVVAPKGGDEHDFPVEQSGDRSFWCAKSTGTVGKIRKNGEEWKTVSTKAGIISGTSPGRLLASWNTTATWFSHAEIEQFRVYSDELTEGEVNAVYNGGAGC
jgi:hypothetical protein